MTPREALVKLRELLDDRGRWTTGSFARDEHGDAVAATDSGAVQFCVVGGLVHVCSGHPGVYGPAREFLSQCTPEGDSTTAVNDRGVYEDVIAMIDCAVEKARETE